MPTKPLLAALLLLTACGPAPADRAKAIALKQLPRLVGEGFRPASVRVYSFPAVAARRFFLEDKPSEDAELVTYTCFVFDTNPNPLSSSLGREVKFAALVGRNDSLTLFVSDCRQREFLWNYGVDYRK